ncbi:MAG: O-antigen polymerase, partial [Ginsengibacter sp.]
AAQGTAVYMVASLNALDQELHNQFHVNYNGYNSLRFFMKLGESLNLIHNARVNDLIPPFVLVPYPTNVYTFYSPYIKDFGKLYAWFIIALLGLIQTFLYNKGLEKKDFRISLWYSLMLFPLVVSFFADQYFSLISFWIQFGVCIEGIILLNKFFTSKKW